jgi:hypothetical protein
MRYRCNTRLRNASIIGRAPACSDARSKQHYASPTSLRP